jgi:ABC-type molybdate transport system permease subunit
MFKFDKEIFIAHPLHTSAFVVDFAVLLFLPLVRPPVVLGMLLLGLLVYLAMFFGAKLALPEEQGKTT